MDYYDQQRKKDEINNIRPYLCFNIESYATNGQEVSAIGHIKNIGLHSACDISICEIDGDHTYDNQSWTSHLSVCAGDEVLTEQDFNFNKTVNYKFCFYDLKSNLYEQEIRYDTQNKKFYSLEPYVVKYSK